MLTPPLNQGLKTRKIDSILILSIQLNNNGLLLELPLQRNISREFQMPWLGQNQQALIPHSKNKQNIGYKLYTRDESMGNEDKTEEIHETIKII